MSKYRIYLTEESIEFIEELNKSSNVKKQGTLRQTQRIDMLRTEVKDIQTTGVHIKTY